MSGIFFDLPSVRFLQRFRFLELMLQTVRGITVSFVECAGLRFETSPFPV
jgi:hypothetical protein